MDVGVTLNFGVLASLPDTERPIFVYKWLWRLDKILSSLVKRNHANDYQRQQQTELVRKCQKDLVSQLVHLIIQVSTQTKCYNHLSAEGSL